MRKVTGWLLCIAVLTALSFVGSVQAVVVDNLYSSQVIVSDRSEQTRKQSLGSALKNMLLKITGNPALLEQSSIQNAQDRATKYLEAYSYASDEQGNTVLKARFSQSAVNALLAQTGIPFWPANRPKVLVWLVTRDYESGVQSVLPNTQLQTDAAPVFEQLKSVGDQLGLPLAMPLMDLEDQLRAQPQQLWSLDAQAIQSASSRYGVDNILVGRVTATSGGDWRIGWWYWQDQTFDVFDSHNRDLTQALTSGLSQVTTYLSRIYAVPVSSEQGYALNVTVTGIRDFTDYAQTLNYFDEMAAVREFQLRQVNASELMFTLYLSGDVQRFKDALALDKKLEPVAVLGAGNGDLQLRWKSLDQ